jgi:hypothetical protein
MGMRPRDRGRAVVGNGRIRRASLAAAPTPPKDRGERREQGQWT